MKKSCINSRMFFSLILYLFFGFQQAVAQNKDINLSVNHVINSIKKAEALSSEITPEILRIPGYSSPRVRHFLNNLCTFPDTRYLEIGVWQGSTFVSALYNNQDTISEAIAIDNWSEFSGPKKEFKDNTSHYLKNVKFTFIETDCFSLPLNTFKNKINLFFYDGSHTFEAQKAAFTYFNPIFNDTFIAIVDDYNWGPVQRGTQKAFKELNYTIHFEEYLSTSQNTDIEGWWNGLYVAVISKN